MSSDFRQVEEAVWQGNERARIHTREERMIAPEVRRVVSSEQAS